MRGLLNISSRPIVYGKLRTRTFATKSEKKSKKWKSVIGLEIHAQISSSSKLFSGASCNFGEPANSCVSFFDCSTPGTLPVLNKKCVEAGVLTALALSSQLNEVSLFDRKHYFYADSPSGYQITQQRKPLATGGELKFSVFTPGIHKEPYLKSSRLKQLQLEQDSGKSLHDEPRGRSLVDLNRAGVPLIEFVFEPDLSDGEEAAALVKELTLILQRLNTCSCKMEEGALRVDANISLHREKEPLGVRTEVKNIFSVRAVAAAIKYEIERQKSLLEKGEKVVNETLSWDSQRNRTVPMRDKEEKQDYRFMPEPNLPPLRLNLKGDGSNCDLVDVEYWKSRLPELPEQLRFNLRMEFSLSSQSAARIVNNSVIFGLFGDIMKENPKRSPKITCNILLEELLQYTNKYKIELNNLLISARQIGDLIDLVESNTINLITVKKLWGMMRDDCTLLPSKIVEENKWGQINDEDTLRRMCQSVLEDDPTLVTAYKKGKTKVIRAMLGQVSKRSEGLANMGKVVKILEDLLK
ncbi:glutamyl-tRNA(Gln) amidotransferase subunit B, mitochondrial [Fopius arisanus]|uniref:Glutamyl-tRNA(Gln) amidotransferase subunit B, mitochondrial n=1 Tax=Fopius arisanus TaxID=64838 RepID=A0A9R1TGN7_9HYME|nr:PREDICTED: glutamyl-tRNA(Gln) amidotransferase subunit B, mitochondrial [Fopius arisanus]